MIDTYQHLNRLDVWLQEKKATIAPMPAISCLLEAGDRLQAIVQRLDADGHVTFFELTPLPAKPFQFKLTILVRFQGFLEYRNEWIWRGENESQVTCDGLDVCETACKWLRNAVYQALPDQRPIPARDLYERLEDLASMLYTRVSGDEVVHLATIAQGQTELRAIIDQIDKYSGHRVSFIYYVDNGVHSISYDHNGQGYQWTGRTLAGVLSELHHAALWWQAVICESFPDALPPLPSVGQLGMRSIQSQADYREALALLEVYDWLIASARQQDLQHIAWEARHRKRRLEADSIRWMTGDLDHAS